MTPQQRIDTFIQDPHKPGCVTGWSSLEKCKLMCEYITKENLKLGVDVGIWGGRSTLSMGFGFQETQGLVWGIDPYTPEAAIEGSNSPENDEWWAQVNYDRIYKSFVDNVIRHNLLPHVRWIVEKAEKVLCIFDDESIDIIHSDGNHAADVAGPELRQWYPKLKRGGYWVADDTNWKEYQPVLEIFEELEMKNIYKQKDNQFMVFKKV